jgi:hypothetical protein
LCSRPFFMLYSPKFGEDKFSEVRHRSVHLADAATTSCLLPWRRGVEKEEDVSIKKGA